MSAVQWDSIFSPSALTEGTYPFSCRINRVLVTLYRMERGYHIFVGLLITLIGLIVTVTVKAHGGKYAGLCILLFGSYISAPLTVAWLSGNTPGKNSGETLGSSYLLRQNTRTR